MLFVVAELAVALWTHSLVLMSDGFHNLSDVVSLYIAFWAQRVLFVFLFMFFRPRKELKPMKCPLVGADLKFLEGSLMDVFCFRCLCTWS